MPTDNSNLLRNFIRESINESSRAPRAPGGGIILHRVGGLSPVKQTNRDAPEKRGLWAFVWPYVEPFLLGSTNDRGVASEKDRESNNTRYGQMKREGMRRFVYRGTLYVRHGGVPGGVEATAGWFRVDADDYARWLSKHAAEVTAYLRGRGQDPERPNYVMKDFPIGANPFSRFSKDEWEVFVPANRGTITSLKKKT